MILYIAVAVISIIFAYESCKLHACAGTRAALYERTCLVAIFILLFAVSACRMNVGNDYAKYVEFMHRLYTDKYISDPGVPTEWGFNLLARVIYALSGYENFLLVFAIYAAATVGIFLVAIRSQAEDFALSFFMFITLGYYFQSFSTVRYFLALAIALYCMKLVNERKWIQFLIAVLIGTGFHKSILVIIPLYFLATICWKWWQLLIGLLISTTFLFFQDFYLKVVVFLYPSYEDTEYLQGSGLSWINILRCIAVIALAILMYNKAVKDDNKMRFYFYLNVGALVLYVFCSFLPIISRIGYYLTVSQILFVPALVKAISDEKKRKLARVAVICACVLYFAMYLIKASEDGVLVLPYKSFFFHDMVNILSDSMGATD